MPTKCSSARGLHTHHLAFVLGFSVAKTCNGFCIWSECYKFTCAMSPLCPENSVSLTTFTASGFYNLPTTFSMTFLASCIEGYDIGFPFRVEH